MLAMDTFTDHSFYLSQQCLMKVWGNASKGHLYLDFGHLPMIEQSSKLLTSLCVAIALETYTACINLKSD
jgi:hypothetical protein